MTTRVFRIVIIFIVFTFLSLNVSAQVRFYAQADAKQIVLGQYFQVSFVLENARGQNFRSPSFLEFEVVGGPSSSTQMRIVNGRSSQKMSYTYSLTCEKIGKYTIEAASIVSGGKTYTSKPIQIEVVKGREKTKNANGTVAGGDIIVEAELDFKVGYVGQQITLKYNILTTQDIRSYNFGRMPSFDGFFAQELQGTATPQKRVVVDGVQYVKRTIKTVALFPQQKGVFKLEEAIVDLGISDGKKSGSFFFTRRLKQFRTKTNSLNLVIKDLPQGAPSSFSGAVGVFEIGSGVDKKSVAMDDALTLTVQVRGYGDGKFIEAPPQPLENDFDIYDPNLISESQQVSGDKIKYIKTFEYLMVPKRAGRISFRPEFSYYNTDSASYMTLRGKQYYVNVLKSTGRELADVASQEIVLTPTYLSTSLKKKNQSWALSSVHWGVNGCFILTALGLLLMKQRQNRIDNVDPALKRREKALRLAQERLSIAKDKLDEGDIKQFYVELRKGLLDYLSDKINLPSSQLSKEEIKTLLVTSNLSEFLPPIMEVMQKGEQAIYASIHTGDEASTYESTIEMIKEIEVALMD